MTGMSELTFQERLWPQRDTEDYLTTARLRALSVFCYIAGVASFIVSTINAINYFQDYPVSILGGFFGGALHLFFPLLLSYSPNKQLHSQYMIITSWFTSKIHQRSAFVCVFPSHPLEYLTNEVDFTTYSIPIPFRSNVQRPNIYHWFFVL